MIRVVVALAVFGLAAVVGVLVLAPTLPARHQHPSEVRDPEHGCGPVSATVVARLLGDRLSLDNATRVVPSDPLGRTSMRELVDGLRASGLAPAGVKLECRGITSFKTLPLILLVRRSHFIVALPVGSQSVIVIDPPHDTKRISVAELARQWAGEAIVVARSRESLRSALRGIGIDSLAGTDSQ